MIQFSSLGANQHRVACYWRAMMLLMMMIVMMKIIIIIIIIMKIKFLFKFQLNSPKAKGKKQNNTKQDNL
jgi:heme/copper-type cytochrome/quinol oxidase subunit 2